MKKTTANNNILNGEKLNDFPLRSGTRHGCLLSLHLLSNVALEFLSSAVRLKKKKAARLERKKLNYFECR